MLSWLKDRKICVSGDLDMMSARRGYPTAGASGFATLDGASSADAPPECIDDMTLVRRGERSRYVQYWESSLM